MGSKHTVVILAGAGASKAVNPTKYPTTIQFFEGLPDTIADEDLFKYVIDFISQEEGVDSTVDIEKVLWRFEELKKFCEQATNLSTLPGWMLRGNKLSLAVTKSSQDVTNFVNLARDGIEKVKKIVSDINTTVYELYAQLPEQAELENNWTLFLNKLSKLEVNVELVTTNYDMVLETVIDDISFIDTGWRGSVVRKLETSLWEPSNNKLDKGLLTKLHGSVNWTRDGDQIYVSDPTFKGSHEKHVIIYPGFKGRPTDPIFMNFHSHFEKVLTRASLVVFIGFAFRDEYINDLCERYIRNNTTTIVINPEKSLVCPLTITKHLDQYFDSSSTDSAIELIRSSLFEN